MQDIPHGPSHRHFFFLLLQSSSDEHLRKHFWANSVACSSSRGHSVDGEFRGFLYIRPSSSASDESSSSSNSSSSSSVGSVTVGIESPAMIIRKINYYYKCRWKSIISFVKSVLHADTISRTFDPKTAIAFEVFSTSLEWMHSKNS